MVKTAYDICSFFLKKLQECKNPRDVLGFLFVDCLFVYMRQ